MYFSIVSFFIFIFIVVSSFFILLQNGLFIKEFTVSNIHIKQLYIKWNEKIDVSIAEIDISEKKNSTTNTFDTSKINKYFTSFSATKEWFNSFVVEKIRYRDIEGTFTYKIGESGFFKAHSSTLSLDTTLDLSPQSIQLTINSFKDIKRRININGTFYFDTRTQIICSNLYAKLSDVADFTIYTVIGKKQLFYRLKSNKKIRNLEYLINLAHLPNGVRYWAYNAIKMSYATLEDITGHIKYDDIKHAYKDIHVQATLYDATYKYNKNLDAIHAKRIKLEFKKGLFYIRPKEAYSYGMYLDNSWVLIDFIAKKEVMLTISLLFDAELNKSVLKILDAYKIKLPFLQNSGKVTTDLKIEVGLKSISVGAKGKFHTKNSNFNYLGLNIHVADATILLNNYDVTIKNMHASYKDIANATVDVAYNAKSATGKIDFFLDKVSLLGITRKTDIKPLHVTYNIRPLQDSINAEKSQWSYHGHTIALDTIELPFNLNTLNITIPATLITMKNIGNALISGRINIKTFFSDIDIDLLNFKYDGFKASQSNTPLHLHYKNKLEITSDSSIYFNASGSKYKLDKFFLSIDKNQLYLKHTLVHIGKYIQAKIYAKLNIHTNKSNISLNDFTLTDPNTNRLLYKKNKILLSSVVINDKIKISSKELEANFVSQRTGWRLKLNAIEHISKNSKLLKELHITEGKFTLFKNKNDKYTRFKAKLKYPYKILLKDKKPTDNYSIKGKIYKEKVYMNINNKLYFTIKDDIQLKLSNSPVNINALLDAVANFTQKQEHNDKLLNINIEGKDSYLYISKDRRILYDTLNVQFFNKILTAQLHHAKGDSGLKLEENRFHLYGKDFNDKFMNQLFSFSEFSKGSLDFSFDGTLKEYNGVIYVKDTTIKDYVILNNMLAFINTIPSLVTFNIPGYNKNGVYVKQAFIHFSSKKNILDIKDIYLDSKEMKITGKGTADLNQKKMDIKLSLKSDLGSDLAKVPVLGYVILGKDTISTTVRIHGDMEDPKVTSLLAKDIIIAPINIIKRTLLLPYKYIHEALDNNTSN